MTLLDPLNYENIRIEESDYTRRAEIDVTLMHKLVCDLSVGLSPHMLFLAVELKSKDDHAFALRWWLSYKKTELSFISFYRY